MKVLVASGSFKDVYNPIETCAVLKGAINAEKHDIHTVPICDGGEYTCDVLKKYLDYQPETVSGVINAYGKACEATYLVQKDEAHIISSEIIRLFPDEDEFKNPLTLTDYGLGQLILDAIQKGYRRIKLYIGGTSTVGGGIGLAQALGAVFYDNDNKKFTYPITGGDLSKIAKIVDIRDAYQDIELCVIADGDAKSTEMSGITRLKVGQKFDSLKEHIVKETNNGIKNILNLTGISEQTPFSGAAGGLLIGIMLAFKPQCKLGGTYFSKLLSLEEKIKDADLVITGEGRYDNTACGKTPASVAALCNKFLKPTILVCGQIAVGSVYDYTGGIINSKQNPILEKMGIKMLITCQEYYDEWMIERLSYPEKIELFRRETPILLKNLFKKVGL